MNKTEVELTTEAEKHKSRRKLLRRGLGVAAAASGAGVLLERSTGTAHATGNASPGTFTSAVAGTPAVTATGTNGANGVVASSDTSSAITGTVTSAADAIVGSSTSGSGVTGRSSSGSGVTGRSTSGTGTGVSGSSQSGSGVTGQSTSGNGVTGRSSSGTGVSGSSQSGAGITGTSFSDTGVSGSSSSGTGVSGSSTSGTGVVAAAGRNRDGTALQVDGHILVRSNAVGQTTLRSERTAVTVRTSAATNNSIIVLTPLDRLVLPLWVTRDTGSFTIHISRAPERDVDIAFLVIN